MNSWIKSLLLYEGPKGDQIKFNVKNSNYISQTKYMKSLNQFLVYSAAMKQVNLELSVQAKETDYSQLIFLCIIGSGFQKNIGKEI